MAPMTLGETIKQERVKQGLSQADLAEKTGCGQSALNRWEGNKIVPRGENLDKLAGVLGIPTSTFDAFKAAAAPATPPTKAKGKKAEAPAPVITPAAEIAPALLGNGGDSTEPVKAMAAAPLLTGLEHLALEDLASVQHLVSSIGSYRRLAGHLSRELQNNASGGLTTG